MASASFLLKGARVIDPASGRDFSGDVLIDRGIIAPLDGTERAAEVLDLAGAVICPGFVDLHTHLREPGREDEETIATGSAAAAAGGFTAICAMPNTDPVCDSASVAEMVAGEGARIGLTTVVPAGAITRRQEGERLSAVGEMVHSPARVRVFTDDGKGVQDARVLRRAMEYIRGFGALCAEHCEDLTLSQNGQMNEGEVSDILGLKGIPAEAEEIALARDLALARLTGVRFHAQHVSTAGSVELIRSARAAGVKVTAEATPHHLSLCDSELVSYDTNFKVNPPLRTAADVNAVRRGLADGTIDAVATDHAPHAPEEKESEFELAPPGMLGLETALAVMLTEVAPAAGMDLAAVIAAMSVKPAGILGLERHGGPLTPGAPANLTVFDPAHRWQVDPARFRSKSRNSPWAGANLSGKVLYTFLDGAMVHSAAGALQAGAR